MKECTKCGKLLTEPEFSKEKGSKDGRRSQCKSCTKAYIKKYYYAPNSRGALLLKLSRLRSSAKAKNVLFDIDPQAFVGWYRLQKLDCHYCGSHLTLTKGHQVQLTDLSIDKKEPKVGYILTNIVFCCRRCNFIKGNWFTEEQMLEIAARYLGGG